MTKDGCIKYAQKIHAHYFFANTLMSIVIYNFLLFVAGNENYARSTRISRLKKYNNIIKDNLVLFQLSDLTSDWLKSVLLEANRDKTTLLVKFIIYLIENDQIEDSIVCRLIHIKNRLDVRIVKDEVIHVLDDPLFERYKEKRFFLDNDGISAYYLSPTATDYTHQNMYNLVYKFIHDYRLNETCKFNSLISSITYTLKMFRLVFHFTSPKDITLQFIRETLKTNNSDTYFNNFIFTKFLYFCIENNFIPSEDYFKSIMHIKKYFLNYSGIDTLQKILCSETPERYTFIQVDRQNHLFYISHDDKLIRKIITSFIQLYGVTYYTSLTSFTSYFKKSLGHMNVKKIEEINYNTFEQQVTYFKQNNPDSIRVVISFYLYIYRNHNKNIFCSQDFHIDVLQRQTIVNELLIGYKYVLYNPYESYPNHDKWLLHYNKFDNSNTDKNKNSSKIYDFSTIKSQYFRNLAKYYFWYDTVSFANKLQKINSFRCFSNYISDIKSGEKLSLFSSKSENLTITLNDVVAYKNYILSSYENGNTINHFIYDIRKILSFLTLHGLITTDRAFFYHLRYTNVSSASNASTIPDDHLKLLSNLMRQNSRNNPLHEIYYTIFYLQLETEFRISQILSLEKDCVFEVFKENQFVVNSKSKTSSKDDIEQPITIYVKRQIDEILKLTSVYRDLCHRNSINNYLFLVPGKRIDMYKAVSPRDFSLYLKNCCIQLGINTYTSSNLRDTHMTKAAEYAIRNSLTNIELGTLTGHKSINTTSQHYIDTEITKLLESVHGVIIGNVEIDGKILSKKPDTLHDEDSVSNNCGYCSSNQCKQFTYLDCMLCKSFITCLDRIPYFEEQVKVLNARLTYTTTRHDKEDLNNIKTLLIKYLEKLLHLKEELNNVG